ncbi:methyl-accepting chemotaxis protein [Lachnospira multipara]|uniref:methyl-accepting chemotaxis protein n=1 Tax=Lachnospira multipara TaxID=28051 RepID=UPI0004E0BCEE|nr:methyl-accepting chemotaxis protein [Lachnospira multipara]
MPDSVSSKNGIAGLSMLKLLMLFGLLPTLIVSCVLVIVSGTIISGSLSEQYDEQVDVIDAQFNTYVQQLYENVGESFFTKPDKDYTYVDSFKNENVELTVFIGDTRAMTSLKDSSGKRIEGTKASDEVIKTVIQSGKTYESKNATVNGEKYYVHYAPIKLNSGEIVGMTFAGKKASLIEDDIKVAIIKLIIAAVILAVIFVVVIYFMSKVIRKALELIANSLQKIASGDLESSIEIPSKIKENKKMVDALTNVQGMLSDSIGKVKSVTDDLSKGIDRVEASSSESASAAGQIENAVEELSSMAQHMAENVSNVNGNVSDMDVTVNDISEKITMLADNSDNMDRASSAAADCMQKVLSSNKISADAVESINKQILLTNESINKINDAITLIIGVASRTKLLSLNASIEAARAGEAGKGFAVVAQNISQLSEQSNDSAATIREIAAEMLENSSETVKLAEGIMETMSNEHQSINDAQNRFSELNDAIRDSIEKIKEIDTKTETLKSIGVEIVGSVEELSALSEENAARNQEVNGNISNIVVSIENIANNMSKMKKLKETLTDATSVFK